MYGTWQLHAVAFSSDYQIRHFTTCCSMSLITVMSALLSWAKVRILPWWYSRATPLEAMDITRREKCRLVAHISQIRPPHLRIRVTGFFNRILKLCPRTIPFADNNTGFLRTSLPTGRLLDNRTETPTRIQTYRSSANSAQDCSASRRLHSEAAFRIHPYRKTDQLLHN